MKRATFVLAVVGLMALAGGVDRAAPAPQHFPMPPTPAPCDAAGFREFARQVWAPELWRRGEPPESTLLAGRAQLQRCPLRSRQRMGEYWRQRKLAYWQHRRAELFRERVTPYYGCTVLGGCGWWAIPAYIVDCESGGDYTPDAGLTFGGAYGLLVSTYQQFGGAYGQANFAPSREQDQIAHRVWQAVGATGWECA